MKTIITLDSRRKNTDGTRTIRICFIKDNERAYFTTQYRCNDKKTIPNEAIILNEEINRLLISWDVQGKIENKTARDIKRMIDLHYSPEKHIGQFMTYFNAFIETKENVRTREVYEHTLKKIKAFDKETNKLDFCDITKGWLLTFDKFMAMTSPARNARNIHLRNIRAVFNYAIDEGATTHYPFRKFPLRNEETAKRSLTIEELRYIFAFNEVRPHDRLLPHYVDMFRLVFLLMGINMVDLAHLKKTDLRNGRIEYRRSKTGKLYSIKVEPEAMEIIERNAGEKYLVNILERYKNHRDYTQHINRALKRIGTMERKTGRGGKVVYQPKFPTLSVYWARHTWATIAASLDIPVETISAALGHSYGSRVTAIYIKFDKGKVDVANRKVIDYVFYG